MKIFLSSNNFGVIKALIAARGFSITSRVPKLDRDLSKLLKTILNFFE